MSTKQCKKCLESKAFSEFYTRNSMKDGYRNECKECVKLASKKRVNSKKAEITLQRKQYYQDNREVILEKQHQYYQDNREVILEKQHQYYQDNRNNLLEKKSQYYQDNKEVINEKHSQYYQENKEELLEYSKQYHLDYYAENRDTLLEKGRLYYQDNKWRYRARDAKRRALLIQQTPKDVDFEKIEEFYKEAQFLTEKTGIPYEVDHIIPLSKGGLHHEDNLQVLKMVENRSKGAKL